MDTERADDSSSQDATGASGDAGEDRSSSPGASEEQKPKEEYYCAASETDDPVRLKCRDLLATALKTPRE